MPNASQAAATASTHTAPLYCIGLMSGTSLDGVDGVLLAINTAQSSPSQHMQQLAFASLPMPEALRAELLALNAAGHDELHRAALASNALMRLYAQVALALCQQSGIAPAHIGIIGAHGLTVRHRPQLFDGTGYTLQLCNGALLAELAGIAVACDFRTRDVAAGGQGAPLVPAFHQALFSTLNGQSAQNLAVLNLGGIANLSILQTGQAAQGFDCGPANALLDYWCALHTGQPYDANGAWAAQGQVLPALLQQMLDCAWLQLPPPKSTGRDDFNPAWLEQQLQTFTRTQPAPLKPADVQATLTQLTVQAAALHLQRHAPATQRLVVCGGGVRNGQIMQGLAAALQGVEVLSSQALGLEPQAIEAAAFAWLGCKTLLGKPLDLTAITGAKNARILGCIYPA